MTHDFATSSGEDNVPCDIIHFQICEFVGVGRGRSIGVEGEVEEGGKGGIVGDGGGDGSKLSELRRVQRRGRTARLVHQHLDNQAYLHHDKNTVRFVTSR